MKRQFLYILLLMVGCIVQAQMPQLLPMPQKVSFTGKYVKAGVPVPGFAAALAHYDQARAKRLNAALTQGLRDYFGAHTYRRIDDEGSWHINWSTDGTEESGDDLH